jgi:hypothetical protein
MALHTHDFLADPRTLTLAERAAIAARLGREQAHWLHRVRQLAEGRTVTDHFPAFLLATPPFAALARRLGNAKSRRQLATGVADEFDWFVHGFADYLRTRDGEDAFALPAPQRC